MSSPEKKGLQLRKPFQSDVSFSLGEWLGVVGGKFMVGGKSEAASRGGANKYFT